MEGVKPSGVWNIPFRESSRDSGEKNLSGAWRVFREGCRNPEGLRVGKGENDSRRLELPADKFHRRPINWRKKKRVFERKNQRENEPAEGGAKGGL